MKTPNHTVPHARCCGLLFYVTHMQDGMDVIDGFFWSKESAQAKADLLNASEMHVELLAA